MPPHDLTAADYLRADLPRATRDDGTPLKMGGLFSGIGGFELAWSRMGGEVAWMCEIEGSARRVLEERFPGVPIYSDIRDVDPAQVEAVDLLTGGSPCQSFSTAGMRKGMDGASGLVLDMLRMIDGLEKRGLQHVIWENVPGVFTIATFECTACLSPHGSLVDAQRCCGAKTRKLATWPQLVAAFLHGGGVTDEQTSDVVARFPANAKWEVGLASTSTRAMSWRVLDSRFVGPQVPQRRTRVFVYLALNNGLLEERALNVLLDRDSDGDPDVCAADVKAADRRGRREPAPAGVRRFADEQSVTLGAPSSGGQRQDLDSMSYVAEQHVDGPVASRTVFRETGRSSYVEDDDKVGTLDTVLSKRAQDLVVDRTANAAATTYENHQFGGYREAEQAGTLRAVDHKEAKALVVDTPAQAHEHMSGQGLAFNQRDEARLADHAYSLQAGPGVDEQLALIRVTHEPKAYRKSARARDPQDSETWVEDEHANTLNTFDLGDVRSTHAIVDGLRVEHPAGTPVLLLPGATPGAAADDAAIVFPICGTAIHNGTSVRTGAGSCGTGTGDAGEPSYALTQSTQHVVAFALRGREGGAQVEVSEDGTVNAIRGEGGSSRDYIVTALAPDPTPAHAFDARQSEVIQYGDMTGPLDTDGHSVGVLVHEQHAPEHAATLTAGVSSPGASAPGRRQEDDSNLVAEVPAMTAGSNGIGSGEANTGVQTRIGIGDTPESELVTPAFEWPGRRVGPHVYAVSSRVHASVRTAPTRLHRDAFGPPGVRYGVRRLTPTECERLQAFPDDWTTPAGADTARYKALGNAVTVEAVGFIERRIVDNLPLLEGRRTSWTPPWDEQVDLFSAMLDDTEETTRVWVLHDDLSCPGAGTVVDLSYGRCVNGAARCSHTALSDILERDVDDRYYLSDRAKAGILKRAQRRGKKLPVELQRALQAPTLNVSQPTDQVAVQAASMVRVLEVALGRQLPVGLRVAQIVDETGEDTPDVVAVAAVLEVLAAEHDSTVTDAASQVDDHVDADVLAAALDVLDALTADASEDE